MHQIALPITRTSAFIHSGRALRNMPFVRMPEVLAGAVGDPMTAFEPQIRLPALPTAMNPVVDRLMTEAANMTHAPHVTNDLLRRKGALQKLFNIRLQLEIVVYD
jgi:hypothetical protein